MLKVNLFICKDEFVIKHSFCYIVLFPNINNPCYTKINRYGGRPYGKLHINEYARVRKTCQKR